MPKKQSKKIASLADLIADSGLSRKTIQIGDHSVVVQELTGRQRFELSSRAESDRWETMLWIAFIGLVEPKFETIEVLEQSTKPGWVVKIANEILAISGMDADSSDEAENE
ncbi:MAG: hypothetical protein E4G74_00160 [Erysipelotrichales bacterium]|nr:MAG: hypothetical protein E4G74_00160 [Erysipelotrichales bacterium]